MDTLEGSDPFERRMERGDFHHKKMNDTVNHHIQFLTQSVKREIGQRRVIGEIDHSLQHGMTKQLVAGGHWNVPVAERPKGWEKMGVPE